MIHIDPEDRKTAAGEGEGKRNLCIFVTFCTIGVLKLEYEHI